MTLNSFITTYRSDFLWPFIRSAPLRPGCEGVRYSTVPSPEQAQERGLTLEEYERILEARRRCQREASEAQERAYEGGRAGPRAPLATTLGTPPGVCMPADLQVARNDRIAQNLKQLQEKHPYLFNVVRSCPPEDLVTRVFKDRYRSVYQVDYCKQGEYPNSEYDALVAGAGLAGSAPGALPYCPCRSARCSSGGSRMAVVSLDRNSQLQACEAAAARANIEGDVEVCLCGLQPRAPTYGRRCSISCTPRSYASIGAREAGAGHADGLNQYHTEYRDVYNKLGNYIISEKVHCGERGRRALLGH